MSDRSANREQSTAGPRIGRGPSHPGKIEKAKDARQALLRFLPYLRPYVGAIGVVFLFVLVYTLLYLLGPYLMGVAIDRFISTRDATGLVRIALLMLIVYLLSSAFQAGADFIMARISQRALQQVRQDLFDHLQSLSLGFMIAILPGNS
jgi:ATP-binding cassette subfamily B multidrug efflux pump